MSLAIYEIKRELVPYSGDLENKELDFLERFQDERDKTYLITIETLKEAIDNYTEKHKLVPIKLSQFLIDKVTEVGDFWFMIS